MDNKTTLTFSAVAGAERLDKLLAQTFGRNNFQQTYALSRSSAKQLLQASAVWLNGKQVKQSSHAQPRDVIAIDWQSFLEIQLSFSPQANPDIKLDILYEDDSIIAINKPSGLPCHPLRPYESDTICNGLLARYPELAGVGDELRAPALVHRLDNDTSGVLIAARTTEAFHHLRQQFKQQSIMKTYIALVCGKLQKQTGCIEAAIAHHPQNRHKMVVSDDHSLRTRPAKTDYRVLEQYDMVTSIELAMQTGVRHQLRVHLASIGNPIVGDKIYQCILLQNKKQIESDQISDGLGANRTLLHASKIALSHPSTDQKVTIECPLPNDFEDICKQSLASRI